MNPQDIAFLFDRLTKILCIVAPLAALAAIGIGSLLVLKPRRVIEWQIVFYRGINWKMEPVSWEHEERSTRFMGAVSVFCGLAGLAAAIRFSAGS